MSDKRTEISDLGEFGLIDHINKGINKYNDSSVKGIGDDAAVIRGESYDTVISSDMLLEGVHFDLSYMPLHHLGYKASRPGSHHSKVPSSFSPCSSGQFAQALIAI